MSGGGTNTVQSNSAPPPQFLNAFSNAVGQAGQVASTPYANYPGQIVAGLSPGQTSAINTIDNSQGIANPYINAASQSFDNATTPIWNNVQQFSPQNVQQYESPFTSDVVNATQAEFNNQNQQQQQGIISNAASSGAWGGDRASVAQGITAGQEQLAQAPVIAGLENQGYNQALGEFNNQQQSQIGANEANAWLSSQAGSGFAGLGNEALSTTLAGANAQLGTGGLEQSQAQANLNVPYQQYLAAQAYPFQTTGWLANISEGLGGASGGTSSTTSPAPSVASQVGGGVVAGAGLLGQSNAFGNASQAGWLTGSGGPAAGAAGSGAVGAETGSFITSAARGGIIPHRAVGGGISGFNAPGQAPLPLGPGISMSVVPGSDTMGSAPATHSTADILKNYGQDSVSSSHNGDSTLGDIAKVFGTAAAFYFGGPQAGSAAISADQNVHFRHGGIVSNDNRPWDDEPEQRRAAGGVTLMASRHGGPDIPILGGGSGIAGGSSSPTALADYFAHEQSGASFAPPSNQPAMNFSNMTGAAPPAGDAGLGIAGAAPILNDSSFNGGNARGGLVRQRRDDGGDVPQEDAGQNPIENPEAFGIPSGGGPSVPDTADPGIAAGSAVPRRGDVPQERHGSYMPPPPEMAPLVMAAAERHGVDPKPLAWLLSTESHWNPKAYNAESGTMGLGQFKPGTANEVGIDPWDVKQAIDGSAKYLRTMLDKFGDYEHAIAHYGTFSTGHGKDADESVRQHYRDFMQNAARGGTVGYADGGGTDDGSDYDFSHISDLPVGQRLSNATSQSLTNFLAPSTGSEPSALSGAARSGAQDIATAISDWMHRPSGNRHISGDFDTPPSQYPTVRIPEDASTSLPSGIASDAASPASYGPTGIAAGVPSAAVSPAPSGGGIADSGHGSTIPAPPPSGVGSPASPPLAQPTATQDEEVKPEPYSPYRTMTNVGLGILAGTSPFAAVNVGAGALKGLALSDSEKRTEAQQALQRDRAKTELLWRQAQKGVADAKAAVIPIETDIKQQRANTSQQNANTREGQGQQKIDVASRTQAAREEYQTWQQTHGDATAAQQQAQQTALRGKWATDQDIRLMAPDPITGKPARTQDQAHAAGQGLRGANAPAATPGATPATTAAQPRSQSDFDGLPPGALYVNPADGKTYRKNAPAP